MPVAALTIAATPATAGANGSVSTGVRIVIGTRAITGTRVTSLARRCFLLRPTDLLIPCRIFSLGPAITPSRVFLVGAAEDTGDCNDFLGRPILLKASPASARVRFDKSRPRGEPSDEQN
jgi:hypothetical protein